ncbi:hypothetical protein EGH26_16225 [Halomicroarcula pellucida]|uniref:DUF7343 domain-containing protein n=1 Tax=Haloarcula pellucida TaxID=1427151 RepID=A0A830GP15_9EURY|nr:hypothetical protein [Halomicroarcula pellucida]MBX0349740.1 hypothetical protein [Halomicroarcula pellucida]GGN94080.1 hypothetical protein GCM10009030_20080 [Halomicroarcula pellucida]
MDKRQLSSVIRVILALTTVLAFSAGVAAGAGAASDSAETASATIVGVSQTHSAGSVGNTTYVWGHTAQGQAVNAYLISVETSSAGPNTELCLETNGATTCSPLANTSSPTLSYPSNSNSTETTLNLTLRDAETGDVLDARSITQEQIPRTGDLDDDGLNNENEVNQGTNVTNTDTDGDGLTDGVEVKEHGTSPTAADTDGDGLSDRVELSVGADPMAADTDGDGLTDKRELELGTDPAASDTDGDGVADSVELSEGTDPTLADTDSDGVTDSRELAHGTDPTVADTDGDGLSDGKEQRLGTDPLTADSDGDGLGDSKEVSIGTDPTVADTDGDGLTDKRELDEGTNPTVADTDGDGLADGPELDAGANPTVADTDGDGIPDGREVHQAGTDPTSTDTDGDLLGDQFETTLGTDPTSQLTPAWLTSTFLGFVVGIGLSITAIRSGLVIDVVDSVRAFQVRLLRTDETTLDAVEDTSDSVTVPDDEGDTEPISDSAEAVIADRADGDLIADDELVLAMLRAEAGRMKQSDIVAVTDWSKAKVSRLLSSMDEGGDIVKLRIGRENLICLEEAKPAQMQLERDRDERSGPVGSGNVC